MFVNWAPFDAVIERDAAEHRFVIDGGYDPDEDRRSTDAAIATLAEGRHDLALVYLALPDLVGHDHGWDSDEYVRALTITDAHFGRLLDALGPAWSVLVTTDHGGVGRNHADLVPDVLETLWSFALPIAWAGHVLVGRHHARHCADGRRPRRVRA